MTRSSFQVNVILEKEALFILRLGWKLPKKLNTNASNRFREISSWRMEYNNKNNYNEICSNTNAPCEWDGKVKIHDPEVWYKVEV